MLRKIKHKRIIILATLMFIVYLLTLSSSLDDLDSVNFALAIDEFDIAKYQPQPPGHPGYVFISKLFGMVFRDHLTALTVQSAVFGALSLVVFYFLAVEMFNKRAAFYSTLIMAVTPLFWLNSVKAMSDITSLFFVLLSFLLIYDYIKYKKAKFLYIGALVSGLSIGIRFPLPALILLPLLLYSFITIKDERLKRIGFSMVLLTLAICSWLVPTIMINGADTYIDKTKWMVFDYRQDKPDISMLGADISTGYIASRSYAFLHSFMRGYGVNLSELGVFGIFSITGIMLIAVMAAIIGIGMYRIKIKDQRLHFFLIGLIPYLIAVFVFLPPRDARHLIPVIPIFSLVFVFAISSLKKYRMPLFAALIILLLAQSIPLAITVHTQEAVPVQMVEYLKENYGTPDTTIIAEGINSRHFEYYGKEINFVNSISNNQVDYLLKQGETVLTTDSTQYEGITEFEIIPIKTFTRDPRVHAKHSEGSIYQIKLK